MVSLHNRIILLREEA